MTSTGATINASTTPTESRTTRARRAWARAGVLVVFAVAFVALSAVVDNFLSIVNLRGLLLSVTTTGIIACTMLFCLAAGDVDLSVGAVVAMSGVVAAMVTNATGSAVLGVLAGTLAGGVVGLVNGTVVAMLGVNALIATLATMQIVRGLSFIASGGSSIGIANASFYRVGLSSFAGVPTPIWVMLACFATFGLVLRRTIFGRDTLAIGGNAEASRLAGIAVRRTRVAIFALQGVMAGLAGVVVAARFSSGQPNTAQGLELQVISACVLGGVSLAGGVGGMGGVVLGVLLMGTVQNALNLLNIAPFYQYVVSGSILLAAVLVDRLQTRQR